MVSITASIFFVNQENIITFEIWLTILMIGRGLLRLTHAFRSPLKLSVSFSTTGKGPDGKSHTPIDTQKTNINPVHGQPGHVHGPDCGHTNHQNSHSQDLKNKNDHNHVHGPDCDHDHDNNVKEEHDPLLVSIAEYTKGSEAFATGKTTVAYHHFREVQQILKNVKMEKNVAYLKLLKKCPVFT